MARQAQKITAKQIRIIKMAQRDLDMSDDVYRALLWDLFRVESCKDLTAPQAGRMIDDLKRKGFELKVKGRPHNINAGRQSRQDQLKKIEALLTVGEKSWAYADALALRICKVTCVAWVPDDQLYKIITALRKQALRNGWDLSGEEK